MKKAQLVFLIVLLCISGVTAFAQSTGNGSPGTNNPGSYCNGSYSSGRCNQSGTSNSAGNSINDFINGFWTQGATANITHTNSGCNCEGGPVTCDNYFFYCSHFLQVQAGQTITCNIQSGITFAQGFAIWVDWNQDNTFQNPGEWMAGTSNVPSAGTWTTLIFSIPANQPAGAYRMRVRCAYATPGTSITPCGNFGFGETEDYTIYVGNVPVNTGPVTATAAVQGSSIVCAGVSMSLSAATNFSSGITFTWTGPNNYSTTTQNPVLTNAQASVTGIYSLTASNGVCPGTSTVAIRVIAYPQYTVTPTTPTICQNGKTFINSLFPPGTIISAYNFQWAPTPTAGVFSPLAPSTSITPLPLPATQTVGTASYSITVTPTALNCPITKTVLITINNPLSPTLTMPPPLCNTSPQFQLLGNPPGGSWSGNLAVTPNGILSPTIAAIPTSTVMYSVAVGSCMVSNTGTILMNKYHTPALSQSLNLVCEQDPYHNLMNLVQDTVAGVWEGPGVTQGRYFSPQNFSSGVYTFTYNTWSLPDSSVCPDQIVYQISVFNPPTPTIAPILPKCNNSSTIQLSATPTGGTWASQAGVTVGGIQTPSLNFVGVNTVTYTAGQGTCVARSTRTFQVLQFNTAALTGSLQHQCAGGPPVNLMSIVQNTAGSWTGVNVTNNVFTPNFLSTGHYTLTYDNHSTPMSTLCSVQSKLVVYLLNPEQPNIPVTGPYCSKDGTVQLSVTPATGEWVPSVYLTKSGVFTPSLAAVGNNIVQYIIGTPTCKKQDTRNISVEAFVPALLTASRLNDLCVTSAPISLQPYSIPTTGSWSGDGLQGNVFNPGLSGAGRFTLTYSTASSPSGLCPDQSTLAVQVYSLAPPIVYPKGPYCSNAAPLQLEVSPLGGIFEGNNNLSVNSSGLFVPASAVIGDNIISYSIAAGPCIAYASTTITIQKFVSASLNTPEQFAFCRNSEPFNLNSIAINPGYFWSGPGVTGSMFNPALANPGNNNFIVYNTHPDGNAALCPDSRTVQVRVDEAPSITAQASVFKGCSPVTVHMKIPDAKSGVAEWNVGDGSPNIEGYSLTHVYKTPGSYSIVLNYSLGACYTRLSIDNPVVVYQSPDADFEFSKPELFTSDPQVDLINTSERQADSRFVWNVQGIGEIYDLHPTVTFQKAGTYKVTLNATSYDKQCTAESTRYIEVQNDFQVFIPNSFSPNHDKINDKFMPIFSPYGLDLKSYQMEIFDRWGQSIFYSNDVYKGWDGTFQNKGDVPVKEGTYVYRISFRDLDGKSYLKVGNLTLLAGQ